MKIRKAVFPVAGLGSRFLPATKAQPKEMLPIVDRPLIQYAVEEAIAAGITELIFITGKNKRAIEDHFDRAYELETELKAADKFELLKLVKGIIPPSVSCVYIRQSEPLGLGHAVLCAKRVVGEEPFAILLADDFMHSAAGQAPVLKQMVDIHAYERCNVLAVNDVPLENTHQYGIVGSSTYRDRLSQIDSIVEKPAPADAPSTLAVVGRYILSSRIFECIEAMGVGRGGEIQLTDGIAKLLQKERVLAYLYEGQRFDCGSKIGYLKATIAEGLVHPETKDDLRRFISEVVSGRTV